jgi:hypothetical protein
MRALATCYDTCPRCGGIVEYEVQHWGTPFATLAREACPRGCFSRAIEPPVLAGRLKLVEELEDDEAVTCADSADTTAEGVSA